MQKTLQSILNKESIADGDAVNKWYNNDYHKMYISEIAEVLVLIKE